MTAKEFKSFNDSIEKMMINKFDELCMNNTIDIVVFSDYNKGVLTEKLCKYIIDTCNQKNIITIIVLIDTLLEVCSEVKKKI
jgi:bifunctional ADP-heptose synthase (sugar kinase/adenylyltransferase)